MSEIFCYSILYINTNKYWWTDIPQFFTANKMLCFHSFFSTRKSKVGISHCPNSNFSLKSGVCDVRRLKEAGVKVKIFFNIWFIYCMYVCSNDSVKSGFRCTRSSKKTLTNLVSFAQTWVYVFYATLQADRQFSLKLLNYCSYITLA